MSRNLYRRRFLSAIERFADQYEPIPIAGCWIWNGAADGVGRRLPYGRFWLNGRSLVAHRAAWSLFNGPIPKDALVCHRCDVPECVNPAHLFLGAPADNTRDMIAKGRNLPMLETRRGEQSNFAKLTEEQALEIRSARGPQREIAARFGISQACVSLIKNGRNWKHANA